MVDIALAWRLFQAADRTRTAIVLLGDHNQLPPVGPGNLLRDLVRSLAIPTTVLTRIIRQAGVLKENSTAILAGEVRPTADVQTGARRPWYVIDKFTDRDDVRRMLLLLFEEVLRERGETAPLLIYTRQVSGMYKLGQRSHPPVNKRPALTGGTGDSAREFLGFELNPDG
jgi:hypothetical protein